MSLKSMTGFATQDLVLDGTSWTWDIRSVNGRGLDVRTRLPDVADQLDHPVRDRVLAAMQRGSVQVTLRCATPPALRLPDSGRLHELLQQIVTLQTMAMRNGLHLAPVSVSDLLDGRLLPRDGEAQARLGPGPAAALLEAFGTALRDLLTMRRAEGRAIGRKLALLVGQIRELVTAAREIEKKRRLARSEALAAALRRVMSQRLEVDPARMEQELALLAVKGDITEELDRLDAHVEAARALLESAEPVGRRLDFLTQEFNREANTLCAKAQFTELTRVGLDLKATIDQLREQVQNVE